MISRVHRVAVDRRPEDFNKQYTQKQKLEAVKLWLVTGNLTHVAAALNIKRATVAAWRYSDWWDQLVNELRSEESIVLNNRLKKIAERSLTEVEDRIENGDWIYDQKTGELRRKPVALRELSKVATDSIDRQLRLEKAEKKQTNEKALADRLEAIAAKFEQIGQRKIEVTDVIYAENPDQTYEAVEGPEGEEPEGTRV